MKQLLVFNNIAHRIELLAKENGVTVRAMTEYLLRHALEQTPAAKASRNLAAVKRATNLGGV